MILQSEPLGFVITEKMYRRALKMATKKDFQVEIPTDDATTPFIFRTEVEDSGLTWGQAKKQLRSWYLSEARKLRNYTEKDFNKQEQEFLAQATANPVEAAAGVGNESVSGAM